MTTPETIPMTDAEYAENNGARCPWCRSNNLESGSPDFDGAVCLVAVDCAECGKQWTDVYELTGYAEDAE